MTGMRVAYAGWYRGEAFQGLVLESAPRRWGRPERLYAVLSVRGDPRHLLLEEAGPRLRAAFDRQRGSVTAALRAALVDFHQWLLERNHNAPPEERCAVGLTLLALRENAAFLAQAGPAWAVHVTREGATVIAPSEESAAPLGIARALVPHFAMVRLRPEDRLFVADGETGSRMDPEALPALARVQNLPLILDAVGMQWARAAPQPVAFFILAGETAGPAPERPPRPVPPASGPSSPPRAQPLGPRRAPGGRPGWVLPPLVLPRFSLRPWLRRPTLALPEAPGWVRVLALALPWAFALAALSVYIFQRETIAAHRLLAQAQAEAEQARQAQAPGEAYRHWMAVRDLARAALQRRPLPEAQALMAEAQDHLDRLDQAVRLQRMIQLARLPPGRARRLILRDIDLYVLDRAGRCTGEAAFPGGCVVQFRYDEVHRALLEESPRQLAWGGMVLQGRPLENLLDVTWAEATGGRSTGALVVLHAGGLMASTDQSPRRLSAPLPPLAEGLLRFYQGNLYVLDRGRGQIWRLRPVGDDYPQEPEPYFEAPRPDLQEAVDFLVHGRIYVLYRDGRVRAFTGGKEEEGFPLRNLPSAALPTPLARPIGMLMDPTAPRPWLYLLEPDRLLQLGPEGAFVRQIRGEGLTDVVAAAVDDRNGRLFFLRSDGALFVADLPPAE